jgi:hypothetical protein
MTPVDARGWRWQVKASVSPTTPRPFYNKAKELLFQDKQITSYTISSYNPELYCEVGKHMVDGRQFIVLAVSGNNGGRSSRTRCRDALELHGTGTQKNLT